MTDDGSTALFRVAKVKVTNYGGYVAQFRIYYIDSSGTLKRTGLSGDITSVGANSRTIVLEDDKWKVPDGALFWVTPYINAATKGATPRHLRGLVHQAENELIANYWYDGGLGTARFAWGGID